MTALLNAYEFESSVNSEYSKTGRSAACVDASFESSVNSEYSKTQGGYDSKHLWFESSVNSEYSKTFADECRHDP